MWSPDLSCLSICEELMDLSLQCEFGSGLKPTSLKRKSTSDSGTGKRRKTASHKRSLMKRSLSFGDSPLSNDEETTDNFLAEETYIADGSRPYHLPVINGQHRDIKSITSETMKDLLSGQYNHVVGSFRVIDCRYPYEYNGGHIQGAENMFTEDQINEFLLNTSTHREGQKSEIIVFHCEFSSKRGPKMLRHLRQKDREMNSSEYPKLNYPEIYLLEGGYKAFYNTDMSLCEPSAYVPMLHEDHKNDVRHFRTKTSRSKRTCSREMKRVIAPQKLLFSVC